jgi:hypothetical protein
MGKLSKDEIRSTVHLTKELTDRFVEACKKKYGEDWNKKTGYRDAMEQFVKDTLGEDVVDDSIATEVAVEPPTQPTNIVTRENMSVEDKIEIAKKLADERKKQQQSLNPPPSFPQRIGIGNDDDIISFLKNVPQNRKIKITRVEIE